MTTQRTTNLPSDGADLRDFDDLTIRHGWNNSYYQPSLTSRRGDVPVNPFEALADIINGRQTSLGLTYGPVGYAERLTANNPYTASSTVQSMKDLISRLFSNVVLYHQNNKPVYDLLEYGPLGVRGSDLMNLVNRNQSNDWEMVLTRYSSGGPGTPQVNRRIFRRKGPYPAFSNRRLQTEVGGWDLIGYAYTDRTTFPRYGYYYNIYAYVDDTGSNANVLFFNLNIGYQKETASGVWDRARMPVIPASGLTSARGYLLQAQLRFPAPAAAPFYTWTKDGSLLYKATTGAGRGVSISDLPPYADSDDAVIAARSGNFSGIDSSAEWDTVLPWTPATPDIPDQPPPTPPTPTPTEVLARTVYTIVPYTCADCYGASRIMPFDQDTPATPKHVAHFYVSRTRYYTLTGRAQDRPVRDRVPRVGTAQRPGPGVMALAAANRSRPYPEGVPADGAGQNIRSGWPVLRAEPELIMAGSQGGNPGAWTIADVLANSALIQVNTAFNGSILAGCYRESDDTNYVIMADTLYKLTRLTQPPNVGFTLTAVGTSIALATTPNPTSINPRSMVVDPVSDDLIIGNTAGRLARINEDNPAQSIDLSEGVPTFRGMFVHNGQIYGLNNGNGNLMRVTLGGDGASVTALGVISGWPGWIDAAADHKGTPYLLHEPNPSRTNPVTGVAEAGNNVIYSLDVATRTLTKVGDIPAGLQTGSPNFSALLSYHPPTDYYKPEINGPGAPTGTLVTAVGADTAVWVLQINPGTSASEYNWPEAGLYDNLKITLDYTGP